MSKNISEMYREKDYPEDADWKLEENKDISPNVIPEKIKLKKKFKSVKVEDEIKVQENESPPMNPKSNISLDIPNENSNKGKLGLKNTPGSPQKVVLKDDKVRQSAKDRSNALRLSEVEVFANKEANIMENLAGIENVKESNNKPKGSQQNLAEATNVEAIPVKR